jgi:hypothetical protein
MSGVKKEARFWAALADGWEGLLSFEPGVLACYFVVLWNYCEVVVERILNSDR